MESKRIPRGKQNEILTEFRNDKKRGAKALSDFLRNVEIEDARQKCVEADNFRILKSIFCSDEVLKAFDDCNSAIYNAWIDLDLGRMDKELWKQGMDSIRNVIPQKMDAFRQAVRAEIRTE